MLMATTGFATDYIYDRNGRLTSMVVRNPPRRVVRNSGRSMVHSNLSEAQILARLKAIQAARSKQDKSKDTLTVGIGRHKITIKKDKRTDYSVVERARKRDFFKRKHIKRDIHTRLIKL